MDPGNPEMVVGNLVAKRMHQAKAIALDDKGYLYVNIGAYSNICSDYDPDKKGCPVLDSAAGIWRFKADRLNQTQADGVRYATGLRNVVGMDWNRQDNQLFVMQHGRDALNNLFPKLYTVQQSALLPAECMYALKEGDNAGWPYMYYDDVKHKKILGPEYGGDGIKEADPKFINPVAAYPGHLAPDGLLFYTGKQFPERYRNGAFIAFHGSWNRAPEPQAGYFVVFQPFKNGRPAGKWEVFADGFAGTPGQKASGRAEHRPDDYSRRRRPRRPRSVQPSRAPRGDHHRRHAGSASADDHPRPYHAAAEHDRHGNGYGNRHGHGDRIRLRLGFRFRLGKRIRQGLRRILVLIVVDVLGRSLLKL